MFKYSLRVMFKRERADHTDLCSPHVIVQCHIKIRLAARVDHTEEKQESDNKILIEIFTETLQLVLR